MYSPILQASAKKAKRGCVSEYLALRMEPELFLRCTMKTPRHVLTTCTQNGGSISYHFPVVNKCLLAPYIAQTMLFPTQGFQQSVDHAQYLLTLVWLNLRREGEESWRACIQTQRRFIHLDNTEGLSGDRIDSVAEVGQKINGHHIAVCVCCVHVCVYVHVCVCVCVCELCVWTCVCVCVCVNVWEGQI